MSVTVLTPARWVHVRVGREADAYCGERLETDLRSDPESSVARDAEKHRRCAWVEERDDAGDYVMPLILRVVLGRVPHVRACQSCLARWAIANPLRVPPGLDLSGRAL